MFKILHLPLASLLLLLTGPVAGAPGTDGESVRVMTFNIEWGGTHVNFDKVVEAIQRAQPDVVGIQEAEGNLERLAIALGWHADRRHYVISRWPLIDPPAAGGHYVLVELHPGRVVALANLHLPSAPYGPEVVLDGATPGQLLKLERRARLPGIGPVLQRLPPLARSGMPVFLTGDFNAPADSDWTPATLGERPQLRYAFDWPVSAALQQAGLQDSWRQRWPNPLTHPGLTWWAARPAIDDYIIAASEPRDRIDFIWYAGPATVTDSEIVGEVGVDGVAIGVEPWPSDHRGVVSTFDVLPAPVPPTVTTDRRVYTLGEPVVVVHFEPGDAASLAIHDTRSGKAIVDGITVADSGRSSIDSRDLGAGHFELRASRPQTSREFWVLSPGAKPAISADSDAYRSGEAIRISWQDAPGNRNDYVAIYPDGETPAGEADVPWFYVDARPSGSRDLGEVLADRWPLPAGNYAAWLLRDDGYEPLAAPARFRVTSRPGRSPVSSPSR